MAQDKRIFGTNYSELNDVLKERRLEGKKVVMASGTFDLFHIGHMRMLAAAKEQGDILVVAVKSDKAAALKKEYPPVLSQEYRMESIANCISADYVIMVDYNPLRTVSFEFKNTTAFEWLNMFEPAVSSIKPDVFVHEDNFLLKEARKKLFEKYNVKSIVQPRTKGISTTYIIDKIETRVYLLMHK